MDETAQQLLQRIGVTLFGMTLDPAIPTHAKEALNAMYNEIEAFLEGQEEDEY